MRLTSRTKKIILCAEDYGQTQAISRGILNLIQSQRLSATTCLVNTPFWQEHASWLVPWKAKVEIGLHFNLTEGHPVSKQYQSVYGNCFFSLPVLLRKSFLRQLDKKAIEAECQAQLDRFASITGFLPDFIDGHQHIHQFPVIRDALIKVYDQHLHARNAYIRLVCPTLKISDFLNERKKIVIRYVTNAKLFKQLLENHNIPHNHSFSGIYSFEKITQYEKLFPSFINELNFNDAHSYGLIMCHPATPEHLEQQEVIENAYATAAFPDTLLSARITEYQYFMSKQFVQDYQNQHNVRIMNLSY